MRKSVFNPKWTQTYKWVLKAEDSFKAFCTSCNKPIALIELLKEQLDVKVKELKDLLTTE